MHVLRSYETKTEETALGKAMNPRVGKREEKLSRPKEKRSRKGALLLNLSHDTVAPGFKNKIRYTPYVSLGSQILHIATNNGNIKRQCSIFNVLSIEDITLDSKQWKDNSDIRVKTPIPQGQLTG